MLVIGYLISPVPVFSVIVHRFLLRLQCSLILMSVPSRISLIRTFFKATNSQPMGTCGHTPPLVWERIPLNINDH